jgi:hypothetical protein
MERINDAEYTETYIASDYYKDKRLDSITIDNFLSEEELLEFEKAAYSSDALVKEDKSMAPMMKKIYGESASDVTAYYHLYASFYTNPAWKNLVEIIQPKLEKQFGPSIRASHIHMLDSRHPYGVHTDAEQPNLVLAPEPAWTLIIPIDSCESKTYVFNERSNQKDIMEFVRVNNIQPKEYSISDEVFQEDFAPLHSKEIFRYLTPETTFTWKRGSCFAADRFKFHCSDNYLNKGIKSKRAIILWTSK